MAYGPPPSPGPAWQQPPHQPPRPAAPPPGPITVDDRNWALMAYIGQFVLAGIAPAIVYLGKARHPFVRRHAAQALNMGIASAAVWTFALLVSLVFDQILVLPMIFTGATFFALVWAGRSANRGEFREVPIVLAWPLVK
ncbi:DUF4870 domain-containing protein [Actinomadura flavalba]|uniref:DUF4870 domain-containing protein n=1 Tax=Actinomadura flavalba TaxID=1120938 RepID=UPI0003765AAC|nr:DUF4870 domain-containing protein [Actinomadura flavalba]